MAFLGQLFKKNYEKNTSILHRADTRGPQFGYEGPITFAYGPARTYNLRPLAPCPLCGAQRVPLRRRRRRRSRPSPDSRTA
jgi:hypothetical protein